MASDDHPSFLEASNMMSEKEKGNNGRADAIESAQLTSIESFSHLDEKKILRKVSLAGDFSDFSYQYVDINSQADGSPLDPNAGSSLLTFVSRP